MKKKIFKYVKEGIILVVSAFLFAVSIYSFVFGNDFTNGGVSGIVAMINYLIRTDKFGGYINLAMNVPLIILSFVGLSREFAIKTSVHILLVSAFLSLFPLIDNGSLQFSSGGDVGKSVIAALGGGAVSGVALALVLGIRGSTGGADILGAFIQRKNPAFSVQWGIFIVNSAIIGISAIVYSYNLNEGKFQFGMQSIQPIMLALIFQFISARMCDVITQGAKTALKFEVITDRPEELSKEILSTLKHGVTVVPATGMYEHKEKSLLICVVKKRQIQNFKDILKKYPGTFAYVASVSEIIGAFNSRT